ncbi:hypothetical protein OG458_42170 (plasmid) [Streptomyces sp. NBC_01281]|uniref:hypothetical protein n=1 Tax=Streptomyces sp. NBC_01281 TaxID=2903811 RepID=UPI002E119E29|nr:hypothetical protein OG458_42170 [Streptomyces sp. NBC_01281]
MNASRTLKRTLPALAFGAALALTTTAPANADTGWWFASNEAASGYFKAYGDKATACDISTDGYKALVQITTVNESLVGQVADNNNDGKCTSRNHSYRDLIEGATYKLRVCTVKVGIRPQHCGPLHEFTA